LQFPVLQFGDGVGQIALEGSPATEVFRDAFAVTEEGGVRCSGVEAKDGPMAGIFWRLGFL
jgi:hypothetical protein